MSNTLVPRYYTNNYMASVASWVWIVIAVIVIAKLLIITIICVRCARRRRMRAFTPGQNVHMNPAYQQQQQQGQAQQNGYYSQQPPYAYTGRLPANSPGYVVTGEKGAQTTGVVTDHGLEAGIAQHQEQQQYPVSSPAQAYIPGYRGAAKVG